MKHCATAKLIEVRGGLWGRLHE